MRMSRYSRRGRARQSGEKNSFWLSFSDLMSALVLVIILVLFYILYQYFLMYDDYEERRDQMVVLQASLEQSEEDIAAQQAALTAAQEDLTAAQTELDEKTAALTAGTYIGGRDIPAGDYILASAGEEGDAGIVSLRSVNDPEDEYPSKLYEFNFASEGYTVYITVEEGDELVVPYPYTLTVSAGVKFE